MGCDYYIQTQIVCVHIDTNGKWAVTKFLQHKKECYVVLALDMTDFDKELTKQLKKNTYKKILYENNRWTKTMYKTLYENIIIRMCPNMEKLVKVYKNYHAIES